MTERKIFTYLLLFLFSFAGCAGGFHGRGSRAALTTGPYRAEGIASWYGGKFNGRKTASGERFNQNAMTCAHRTLPFGSKVRVTNLANGQNVTVRVNDRGPWVRSRLIDLSRAAAKALEFLGQGMTRVRVEKVS